jgi:hypothetical protein
MKEIDPLTFLKAVYMNVELPLSVRMRAAMAVLPFTHPKLAVTAVVSEQDFATVLDRRLKRIEEMKLLERKTINGNAVVSEMTIDPESQPAPPAPPPLNRIYDKRGYRRI